MTPKLIKSPADHAAALARIQQLFDAKPGTPEADELELLVHLVDQYETAAFPIDLPDPVEAIRFRMEQAGLKPCDLEPYLGTRSKVSEVLSGKRELSLSMIRRLHQGLGIPAAVLLGRPGAALPDNPALQAAKDFPLAEMHRRGWFDGFTGTLKDLRQQAEDVLTRFVQPLGSAAAVPALNRLHVRHGSTVHHGALQAWRIRVVGLASRRSLPPYTKGGLNEQFLLSVARLSYLNDGPLLARELLNKKGIHLIVEPHLSKTHLDGAAIVMPDRSPLIALTARHDRLDNFWFTLLHELAHVALHLDTTDDVDAIFDDLDNASMDKWERQADALAREALIPTKAWNAARLGDRPSTAAVKALADQLQVHPAIVAGRVRFQTANYMHLNHLLGRGAVRKLFLNQPT
jgi:HTH-type transcriptional regulator / antitoxin HigA